MKILPIGISDYKQVIDNNYYYVDKTLLVKELLISGGAITLLPRPRRFGKTLNLSMLRYFFEKSETDTSYLFKKTTIWNDASAREHQGQYPVIFLTFKNIKELTWHQTRAKIYTIIAEEFNRHGYLLKHLDARQAEQFNAILNLKADQTAYGNSLLFLTQLLHKYHNKKVILLLDEYDGPMHAAYSHSYYPELTNFMRSLLTSALKDNPHLSRGVITGILRAAKEGIFSGLNNLAVFTILSLPFQDKFGFTQTEVKQLLKDQKLSDKMDEITTWYNGYMFGQTTIYNPWSLILCANERGLIRTYWLNTSDNQLIKHVLTRAGADLKAEFEDLLNDKPVIKEIDEGLIMPGIENKDDAIWNLMVFAGYLSYSKLEWIEAKATCTLKIPNKEIKIVYTDLVREIFKDILKQSNTKFLLQALIQGDAQTFQEILQDFIIKTISAFDLPSDEPEKSYHLFILGLLVQFHDSYQVKSNRESGYGRYDIMLIPRKASIPGIIMEFKKVQKGRGETLDSAADKALQQIKSKEYITELHDLGVKRINLFGIAFLGKKIAVQCQNTP